MNTTRFLKLTIGAILVLAVLVAFQAYNSSGSTKGSSISYAGMGDLHGLEARSNAVKSGTLNGSSSFAGMGDLHRLDAQAIHKPTAGMGDLHRFEGQGSSHLTTGMGDLQRFNAQQVIQNTR